MAKTVPIQQGEKFIRPEAPGVVWVIEHLVEFPGLPMHAKLVAEKRRKKMMTISESALRDPKFYSPLEDQTALPLQMRERAEPQAPSRQFFGRQVPCHQTKTKRRLFGIDFDSFPSIGPLLSR